MENNAEGIEARLKEEINPLVGTRITKEVLANVLKRVTDTIRERLEEEEPEPQLGLNFALGPDGEIRYNPPPLKDGWL